MSSNSNKPIKHSPKDAMNATNKSNYGVSNRSSSQSSSQCASPTKTELKKLPPIKAPVGLARGPDLKHVTSKIGSFDNVKHRPKGGEKKVESQKLEWNAKSRIGSLENARHKPLGGEVKVRTQKLEWKASSKIGSLDNVKHTPGGGSVKIFDEKYGKSASAATTPTPSKSGSITPTIDTRENCDTTANVSYVSSAPNSNDKFEFTSRPNTANSIASSQKPSVDEKPNNFKQSSINSQFSAEKSV